MTFGAPWTRYRARGGWDERTGGGMSIVVAHRQFVARSKAAGRSRRFPVDQGRRAHRILAVVYSKRGVVDYLYIGPDDASSLGPAYKQPARNGAAGLAQHRLLCSVIMRARRRRPHARMGPSSDIAIWIHERISITGAARIECNWGLEPGVWAADVVQSLWPTGGNYGSLHHLLASLPSRRIRVCL